MLTLWRKVLTECKGFFDLMAILQGPPGSRSPQFAGWYHLRPMAAPPPSGRSFDRSLVEGPIARAVWRLAWPTMLQNVISGFQGVVDHALVGHLVGYTGNAAIGVSLQIFIVVIVFLNSLFTGMSVLVARFAGANEPEKVNRTVYQAFITSAALCVGILAPLGWALSPSLLRLVNATAEVRAEALPYLRIMLVFSFGMMLLFMLGAALRSAGDARTPLRLGIALTVLNVALNVVFIRGLGPIPAFGTAGAAIGASLAGIVMSGVAVYLLCSGRLVVTWSRGMDWRPDWGTIRALFRFGLPTGVQGIAMNVGGVLLLRFIGSLQQSAQAQAAYAVGYTELFSLITWTSMGLMGAAAAVAGQNLGAGRPERVVHGVHIAARIGLGVAAVVGALFLVIPDRLLALFGMHDPVVVGIGTQLLRYLSVSGLFITVALTYTGALQGTGDTRSPLYISLVSQIVIPLGLCAFLDATRGLHAADIWLAILLGHATRCALSVLRFRQGKWRAIQVDIEPA
jgi:putative MATE family efflux protein